MKKNTLREKIEKILGKDTPDCHCFDEQVNEILSFFSEIGKEVIGEDDEEDLDWNNEGLQIDYRRAITLVNDLKAEQRQKLKEIIKG